MRAQAATQTFPAIVLGATDHARLTGLADALAERQPELADDLFAELERATVVPSEDVPESVVRMGSMVTFAQDGGEPRTVTLVFPVEADIEAGRISIATPVGVALIGLAAGQVMHWQARDGRSHTLTVLAVGAPPAVAA